MHKHKHSHFATAKSWRVSGDAIKRRRKWVHDCIITSENMHGNQLLFCVSGNFSLPLFCLILNFSWCVHKSFNRISIASWKYCITFNNFKWRARTEKKRERYVREHMKMVILKIYAYVQRLYLLSWTFSNIIIFHNLACLLHTIRFLM